MKNAPASGLLGDTSARDYSSKLRRFSEFAAPELRQCIGQLDLRPGMRVLDAGCGTGAALRWLWDRVQPGGEVVGIDLATAHVAAARAAAPAGVTVLQADLLRAPLAAKSFDLVWCVNTINHVRDRLWGVQTLATLLRPSGRIALGQSCLVPDMVFAWDARLERVVTEAVRQYYRDRYQLNERDLTSVRALVGVLRAAKLQNVRARTVMMERLSPLSEQDEAYLNETVFRDTWGARLRPYMVAADYEELTDLCDPQSPRFALKRPDFHFLQSFTLVVGEV